MPDIVLDNYRRLEDFGYFFKAIRHLPAKRRSKQLLKNGPAGTRTNPGTVVHVGRQQTDRGVTSPPMVRAIIPPFVLPLYLPKIASLSDVMVLTLEYNLIFADALQV
jgi:hypothetical protein